MLRCTTLALGAILSLATLPAQTNVFEIYPNETQNGTTWTSRFGLGSPGGEMLQGVPARLFSGVGGILDVQGQATCQATQFLFTTQDQNCATQETCDVVFRQADAMGRPIPLAAGEIARFANLGLPPNQPAGPCAWRLTLTFTTAVSLPCEGGFFMGSKLNAAAAWTADGQSIHAADYTAMTNGDHPRPGAPNHCYQINTSNVVSIQPANGGTTLQVGIGTLGAVANGGGEDPASSRIAAPSNQQNYGAGGMYPDLGGQRRDGLWFRTRDLGSAGGLTLVFLGRPIGIPGGIGSPGIPGRLWLQPSPLFFMGSAAVTNIGFGYVNIVMPGGLVLNNTNLDFQGINVNATFTQVRLTNHYQQQL